MFLTSLLARWGLRVPKIQDNPVLDQAPRSVGSLWFEALDVVLQTVAFPHYLNTPLFFFEEKIQSSPGSVAKFAMNVTLPASD